MKELKALIKIELKPSLIIGLYFLVINIGCLAFMKIIQNKNYYIWIRYGYVGHIQDLHGQYIFPFIQIVSLFAFLGIILLVYFQFKDEKSIEIGRFIKALPYRSGQRCLTKVVMGILSYTIPFIVLAIGALGIRQSCLNQFQEFYNVFPNREAIKIIVEVKYLIQFLILTYAVVVFVYLFMVMVQYLMNNTIGSMITSILVLAAPLFIVISLETIYSWYLNLSQSILDKLFLPFYAIWLENGAMLLNNGSQYLHVNYSYIGNYSFKLGVIIVCIILLGIIIWKTSQISKIEDGDMLIPYSVPRWLFIIGVTVCGGMLVADLGLIFLLPLVLDNIFIGTQVLLLGGGIISFYIAYRIANIGVVRKEKLR